MRRTVIVVLAMLMIAAPVSAIDFVERRGAEGNLQGTVVLVDDAGVLLRSAGRDIEIPWDRVRRVIMEQEPAHLDEHVQRGLRIWRARSRVERGDTTLAEPLLDRLFERYRTQTNETALVVAEGLLRCRVARGAHAGAVLPALEVARLRRAGVETDSYGMLSPGLDGETMLCPQLAPAWMPSPALEALQNDLSAYETGDEVVDALASLYRVTVQWAMGAELLWPPVVLPEHVGVQRLHTLVECLEWEPDTRHAARARLSVRLDGWPSWSRAWARFVLGASLLQEAGVGRQRRGMVSMLHLPARHAREHPYLAGLALAWVIEASRDHGNDDAAAVLQTELIRRFPGHPIRDAAGSGERLNPRSQEGA